MPKNAYLNYMLEVKRLEEKARGHLVSMAEVSRLASISWEVMSDEEKKIYKERAKDESECGSESGNIGSHASSRKFSSQSSVIEKKNQAKLDEHNYIKKRMNSFHQKLSHELEMVISKKEGYLNFINYPFILMYGNFFYRNIDGEYSPAEIGLAKFTFADGLDGKNRFQIFVDPGRPEMGYLADAKEHVERTHRTPVPGMDVSIGENDLRRVHSRIMNFLQIYGEPLDNGKPIVFTYADKCSANDNQVNVLKSFMRSFSDDGEVHIDIFPLEQLFITLRKTLSEKNFINPLSDNFADVIMSREPFDVLPSVSCQHHQDVDRARYCALSFIECWSYILADNFCQLLGVECVAGKHIPTNAVPQKHRRIGGINWSFASRLDCSESIKSVSMSTLFESQGSENDISLESNTFTGMNS